MIKIPKRYTVFALAGALMLATCAVGAQNDSEFCIPKGTISCAETYDSFLQNVDSEMAADFLDELINVYMDGNWDNYEADVEELKNYFVDVNNPQLVVAKDIVHLYMSANQSFWAGYGAFLYDAHQKVALDAMATYNPDMEIVTDLLDAFEESGRTTLLSFLLTPERSNEIYFFGDWSDFYVLNKELGWNNPSEYLRKEALNVIGERQLNFDTLAYTVAAQAEEKFRNEFETRMNRLLETDNQTALDVYKILSESYDHSVHPADHGLSYEYSMEDALTQGLLIAAFHNTGI